MDTEAVQQSSETASTVENGTNIYTPETIANLSNGIVNRYKPQLDITKILLSELLEKQTVLVEQIHDENLKVSWTQNSVDLQKMFDTISTCHMKLSNIKKEMRGLHDKSIKLKKRALRLQHHKEKAEYLETQQKQMDLKREQDLIGSKPPN
ncbi:PREDICTED: biogenesis of lysosome-related organelles complex 1 subunit 6 [Nicrophorus vespilloides]|uniref:Biogenesis of lysosome-related organelles complex 1 subunit 6 n=1 Tax=Nicrophorus vespilloides TaxID=110193 RepID=A0ABM1NIB2_NICVS|nr:PREDICTED: biogenesis of lysosome-related organelles complex 1 subunit 6 [Nicrophorus vespilloides]